MTSNDQYALNWSNHTNHIRKAFDSLLSGNEFVDVTLSCEGRKISAHKMLLSACSTYFHDLFRDNPCQHPIVILRDVKFQNLVDILKFVYSGEVSVATENFNDFLKTAELLQISGLTEEETRNKLPDREVQKVETVHVFHPHTRHETDKPIKVKEIIEKHKENESTRKRVSDVNNTEDDVLQKKLKENEGNAGVNIKQENEADVNDDNLIQIKDPLDLEEPNDSTEGFDVLQPASQQFVDVQDLLNNVERSEYRTTKPQKPGALRLTERHFPDFIPPTEKKVAPTRRCVVCCNQQDSKGKKRRKESRYYCQQCNVGLCAVSCFKLYHSELNF